MPLCVCVSVSIQEACLNKGTSKKMETGVNIAFHLQVE